MFIVQQTHTHAFKNTHTRPTTPKFWSPCCYVGVTAIVETQRFTIASVSPLVKCACGFGWWTSTSMLSFLFSPGKEPGPGADICELHLQFLPGCSTQLFCFRGPDDGLFPSTPGEPGHCGPTSHRCHHTGGPGWTAGAGLCGAVCTVRTVWPMCCTGTTFMCV